MKLMEYFTLEKNNYKLIKDVIVRPLKVNRDPRGYLIETLKADWKDIFNDNLPFTQNYFSKTESNIARDEDRWHVHETKQVDRFVVIKGKIVVAMFDWRRESSTYGLLNLFLMGELKKDEGYYNLMVPTNVLHCFLVVGKEPGIISNYPSTLYDPKEEGRIPFDQVTINQKENFSWNLVRKDYNLPCNET